MDFLGLLPKNDGFDFLWVILCRLKSNLHLIPFKTTTRASELAWQYVQEIVWLHGLSDSIVSNRDTRFTSKMWQDIHHLLGTKLHMSMAFHPQTDGATERANHTIEQILRSTISPDQHD